MKSKIFLSLIFAVAALAATEKKTAKIHPSFGLSPKTEVLLKQVKKANKEDGTYVLNENDLTGLLAILQKADIAIKATVENIANAKTIGYKRLRTVDSISGKGMKLMERSFSMGMLQSTGHKLDIAISSDIGLFAFSDDKGQISYSRDGSLKLGSDRILRDSLGHKLIPQIQFEPDDLVETLTISEEGIVAIANSSPKPRKIGQIKVFQFQNTADLTFDKTCNCFHPATNAAKPLERIPGLSGTGGLLQGFLELSNVNIAEEQAEYLSLIRFYNLIYDTVSRLDSSFVGAYKTHPYDPNYVKTIQK